MFFVHDIKHDLHHTARLVTGRQMRPVESSSYSSVIPLTLWGWLSSMGNWLVLSVWLVILENAYLESYTWEILIEVKTFYGLHTSDARYRERLADTLRIMGFKSCVNEPDLWMRCNGPFLEYVCIYVDDLVAILVVPKVFFDTLMTKYKIPGKGCWRD